MDGYEDDTWDFNAIFEQGETNKDGWVRITPESVAILSLTDSLEQIERSASEPNRLMLAVKSAHLALQAALTAALAGSANIGAHPDRLRLKYLDHLHDRGAGKVPRPENDRVMDFSELLDTVTKSGLPWGGEPVQLTDDDRTLLDRLTSLRHAIEHPKQMSHSIEREAMLEPLSIAAKLTVELLASVFHHLAPGELERLYEMQERIAMICNLDD